MDLKNRCQNSPLIYMSHTYLLYCMRGSGSRYCIENRRPLTNLPASQGDSAAFALLLGLGELAGQHLIHKCTRHMMVSAALALSCPQAELKGPRSQKCLISHRMALFESL